METDERVSELLEELIKNPDIFFPSFTDEMAEKARQELCKAFSQYKESDKNQSVTDGQLPAGSSDNPTDSPLVGVD